MPARSASLRASAVVLLAFASASPAAGQSLSGSRASLDRQNEVAEDHDFSFLGTSGQVGKFVNAGYLVPVEPNGNFELHQVSYPYARPQVQLFVERLAAQYVKACGERLVVTSLTRPESEQPRNASDRSVHPTGMAVDLRLARNRRCRSWLEGVLLDLERARVIEATRERRPAHYHIAVFPQAYADYVATKRSETLLVAEVERIREPEGTAKPEPTPVPDPVPPFRPALETQTIPYRVRPGDALWTIALAHGTTVERLRSENALPTSWLVPGQVLEVPIEQVQRAPATEPAAHAEPIRYRVRSGDSLWTIARKHGTTVERLKTENALASARIVPGQLLELPVSD